MSASRQRGREKRWQIPDVEGDLRREFQIGVTEGTGKPLNGLLMLPGLKLANAAATDRKTLPAVSA